MKPYEILEHTADVGLKVNGTTLGELFENAAKGMFVIIGGRPKEAQNPKFKIQKKIQINKSVNSLEELLVEWLSELLYIFDKDKILFHNFKISNLSNDGKIVSETEGEKIDLSRYTLHTEIKACTFHELKIKKNKNGFTCNVIFDV